MSENKSLKQQKFDMEALCDQQKEYNKSAKDEISRLESALFNAKSEVSSKVVLRVSRGRCYDRNFLRFVPVFGEKNGVFLIFFLQKLAVV
jgi:hypothetical protein